MKARYIFLFLIGISNVATSPSFGACSWTILSNGTTADASQVMNNLDCLAPKANPSFTGMVAIGSTSPSTMLNVYYPGGATAGQMVASFESSRNDSSTVGTYIQLISNTGGARNTGVFVGSLAGKLVLDTSSVDRVVIDTSGNVGIGTATPGYLLHVNGTAAGTSWTNLSDIRYKRDVLRFSRDALSIIAGLQPVTFYWKSPKDAGMRGRQIGLIAQDVERKIPEIVVTQDNAEKTKSINYNGLVPVLIMAVQQLRQENIELKREVVAAKGEGEKLKEQLGLFDQRLLRVEHERRLATVR